MPARIGEGLVRGHLNVCYCPWPGRKAGQQARLSWKQLHNIRAWEGTVRRTGDDIPRTTSRTEVGSAKASRMNSCGIFGSAPFSILKE